MGDLGYLDEDGFLYLTDRSSFMIISGGVNIYPQEIENAFTLHPKVADIGVIGVPDPEMGERVVASSSPPRASRSRTTWPASWRRSPASTWPATRSRGSSTSARPCRGRPPARW